MDTRPIDENIIFDGDPTFGFTQNYIPNPSLGQTDIRFLGTAIVEVDIAENNIFEYIPNPTGNDVDIIFNGEAQVYTNYLPNPDLDIIDIEFDGDAEVTVCWTVEPENDNNGDLVFNGNADTDFDDTFEYIPNPDGTTVDIVFDGDGTASFCINVDPNPDGTDVDIIFNGHADVVADITYVPNPDGTDEDIIFNGHADTSFGDEKGGRGVNKTGATKSPARRARTQRILVQHEPSLMRADAKVGFAGHADAQFYSATWSPLAHPDMVESKFSLINTLDAPKKSLQLTESTEEKKKPKVELLPAVYDYEGNAKIEIDLDGESDVEHYDHHKYLENEDEKIIESLLNEQTRMFSYIIFNKPEVK
jgi:hypothetical protein